MVAAYRAAPLRAGDPTRLGDYQLVGRLGAGGMGTVYLAERDDGSHVAIKVIHAALGADPVYAARFRGEVERARQVPSFCTARFLDADLDHQPPYLVIEYVDGPSLTEVVAERGPLQAGALHSLAVGVATALAGIHGAGVIHRDLKPGNVLLPPGSTKVIDFGLSRPFDSPNQLTRTGIMVGTVTYIAPERMSQQARGQVTAAADIFSWGCVMVYAATGRTPFEGDSPSATINQILTQQPNLDGLPEPLRGLVGRALSKDPADRPTAAELLNELTGTTAVAANIAAVSRRSADEATGVVDQRGSIHRPQHRPGNPPARRRRLLLVGAAAAAAAVLLGACALGLVMHHVNAAAGAAVDSGQPVASSSAVLLVSPSAAASPSARHSDSAAGQPSSTGVPATPKATPKRSAAASGVHVITTNVGKTGTISGPGAASYCVDVDTNTDTNGNKVQLYDCNGVTGQEWTLATDGTLRAFNKCLSTVSDSAADRAQIDLWECNGTGSQQWRQRSDGSFLNPRSGRCLDDPGGETADKVQLQLWDCNGLWPQAWHFG